jgi:hypothetical protein
MKRERKGLQAYRELYGAVCELSESLFDQAVALYRDERRAAAVASVELIRALEHKDPATSPSGLMRRLSGVRWGTTRRRATTVG